MQRFNLGYLAMCLLGLTGHVLPAAAAAGYHLIKTIPLGAAEGGGEYFDYITVDPAARRVYVSHGTEVKVLDADSYAVLDTIGGFKRDHGVAVVPALGRGFVSDGDLGEAIIFDLKTFKKIGEVKADRSAHSILCVPVLRGVFVLKG